MAKILLVEDDSMLAKTIAKLLTVQNHAVDKLDNGTDAVEYLRSCIYDLIILDWDLPGCSGLEVCKKFREGGGKTPVLMLTGRGEIGEKKEGFTAGADDYLTKPFHMQELELRLAALLRRPHELVAPRDVITYEGIIIDVAHRSVTKGGAEIKLLPREFALLEFLIRHPKTVFSSEVLVDRVWKSDSEASPDAVRIYVTRLRHKLDSKGTPSIIETVHGSGYRLREPKSSA